MTYAELNEELRALEDLAQRYSERFETLSRRLYRHFDASPGSGKTDYRLLSPGRNETLFARKTARDDEDDGE